MTEVLPTLDFPFYPFTIRTIGSRRQVYDRLRKKFVRLTPEEWVRQHMIRYLVEQKKVPESLIAVEKVFRVFKLKKRFDIAVYDPSGQPLALVECKAPGVGIARDTFDQAARYNLALHVGYLIVTNGMTHYCCQMDEAGQAWQFLPEIPEYSQWRGLATGPR